MEPDVPLQYFKHHKCSLPQEKLSHRIVSGKLARKILELTSVSINDARARAMFRSYASFGDEKYRQYKYYKFSIHPFSKLRLYFELFMAVLIFLWCVAKGVHGFAYYELLRHMDFCAVLATVVDTCYYILIFMNFFTGYVEGDTQKRVVLDLKKTAWRYFTTWFVFDSMTNLIKLFRENIQNIDEQLLISMLRILKIPRCLMFSNNFLKAMNFGIIVSSAVRIFLYISTYLCWNMVFQYKVEWYMENDIQPTNPRVCSWLTVTNTWNQTTINKFAFGLKRGAQMLRATFDYNEIKEGACTELFLIIAMFLAQFVTIACGFLYMVIVFATGSAKMKYYAMTELVQNYVTQKRLPRKLQKMILKYYSIRFKSHFLAETRLLETVTGQLREDIIIHTRNHLIQNVTFLKKLPQSLQIRIAMKLKMEVVNAGDVIFKIGSAVNCCYFIDHGTVTLYTASGNEYHHLEDGDSFGARPMILNEWTRVVTAVAVTNCELFRLDREDFETSLACYPEVYEEMKKAAIRRTEKICLLEDQVKRQMKIYDIREKSVKNEVGFNDKVF